MEEEQRRARKGGGSKGKRRRRRRSSAAASVRASIAVATRGTGSYQAALLQRETAKMREAARLGLIEAAAEREKEEAEAEHERVVRVAQMVARGLPVVGIGQGGYNGFGADGGDAGGG